MPRHVKEFYKKNEQQQILDHIIEKNLYFQLRGRLVWQEMEKLEICPGRSWQSMKHHFHSNMINSLHSLHISEAEKKRILDCYYNRYLYSPMKRKRMFCSSNIETENQHNAPKKSKLKLSDVENECEKFPELIDACNRKTMREHTSNNRNVEDTQISASKEIDSNLCFMNKDNKNDLDSSLLEPYSILKCFIESIAQPTTRGSEEVIVRRMRTHLDRKETTNTLGNDQEDKKIIIYIKENMNWADLEYFDNIYESCHKQVLSKRSTTSIKKRFLNVILPNLYKYNILDVDEILLFYDRAGIDIPPELEQILSNLMEKNSTLVQDEYSLNSTNYNIDGGIILSNIEKNTNMNSQKNTKDIIQQRTEGTNLEKKSSVYNHTDQDNSLNNILQNTNISFNNDKESYAFSNINQSGSSTSKNFHDNNMVENKKNHIYQTENSQESKNIEKIDVAVQANVVNFKIMARFVADQLCLNINNEEHVFVPESKNNKQELMNELNVQHNIIYDNIHVIDNKIYNTLQRFKTLNEILERKILNLKIKNITNPTEIKLLPENFNKIQPLICPCVWKKLKKYIAPAIPVNKRRSRVVHLPVKLQHLNDNKHLEKICKCCTEDKKLKERKKFQKSNVPKANNDNASFLTENKTKGVESNCSTDELQKKNVTDNKNDKAAKLEIDDSSDHSSPIISMSRRNQVTIVNVNSLISRKVQSCNTAKSGENIARNGHISNINSEILPINYNPSNKAKEDSFSITNINSEILPINPSNRANDDSLSIPFATAEIYDTTMLEYKPEFNYYSSDPLCSSHIPYLNDRDIDSPELSMLPSTLFNRHNEELKLDNDMETINISTFIVQSNTIKNEIEESADRNEITVWPIINEESNIIYSDHNKDKIKSSSSLFYEMDENFDPSTSISYQSHNLFEEEIQQTKLENSVEKDNSVVLNSLNDESINIEFKDDVELNRNTNRSPSCQLKENSSKNQLHNFLDLQVKKDEYNSHLSEINSISQVHYLVSDDNACDNIVLQKTRCTYEKKILSERCRTLNDEKHIESSNLKCETSYSTAKVAMESINTQYLVNIDLDNDTSANNITLPLNFEENSRLEIRSSELSEIRLSSNIEEETKSDSTHLETFKSVPVVVHLKKNQVVKVTKYI